jgi:hypothetical protein
MAGKNKKLRYEMLRSMTSLITVAFGLVAALAWNGAISSLFVVVFGTQTALLPQIGYAVLVTVIAVLVTFYMARLASKIKEQS